MLSRRRSPRERALSSSSSVTRESRSKRRSPVFPRRSCSIRTTPAGLASSLRTGLVAAPTDVGGALILLGDMPRVETALIDALIAAFEARPEAHAVAPIQKGRRGNPVLLSRSLFGGAMLLKGDEGARRIVAALDKRDIAEVHASGGGSTFDVDTPGDLLERSQPRSED